MKTITAPTPYGYQELRLLHQRYMSLAMLVAVTIQMMVIGGYHLSEWLKPPDPPVILIQLDPRDIISRSIINRPVIGSQIDASSVKLVVGMPVPIPDCEVNPNITYAGQDDINRIADRQWSDLGDLGDGKVVIQPDDIDPPPDKYTYVEIFPTPILMPKPEYPELGIKIDLEGSVTVKALLDKEGKVKRTIIAKTSHEMFNQPALDAAQKCVFTPALMNGKPVQVWVSIPFKFKLRH